MARRACCFAGVLLALQSPYSCHKPTPQELYASSKACFVTLDSGLKTIPAARFTQAGLDPALVRSASQDMLSGAYTDGKQIGMTPAAVSSDIERARLAYLNSHAAAQGRDDLRKDVNECLGDYYGRPND